MIGVFFIVYFLCTSVMGKEKAILEIVMHTSTENGEYDTKVEELVGHFTTAGPMESAEGNVLQVHPMSICNHDNPERRLRYGWVGVIKLEINQQPCMTLYQKARKAIQRGATAVVFDISNNPTAVKQLKTSLERQLDRPVIVILGHEAKKLMRIVRLQKNARARIRSANTKPVENNDANTKEYFDMGIFVAVFVLFCIICIIVIIKLKWRHREQQLSMAEKTKRAIAKLETRKYNVINVKPSHKKTPLSEIYSSSSSGEEACAICLEDYGEGEILRVLPCSHEFHRSCVDQWLVTNRTCPLCLFNIVDHYEPVTDRLQTTSQRTTTSERQSNHVQLYDIPHNDNYNTRINDDTRQHIPSYSHFIRMTRNRSRRPVVHHGCPSCQGTMGSSPSSGSSYLREFRPIHSGHTNVLPVGHTYQNIGHNQCLHQTCCHDDREQHMFHSYHPSYHRTVHNSGISYSHHYSIHDHSYHRNNPCKTTNHTDNLYQTSKCKGELPKYCSLENYISGKMWDSDPECVESVKNSSITANYGSCSSCSNGNPSYSSLDCDCCQHYRQNIDSTHSTYGSSDNKDKTDVSSCDSNVFWGGAPDQMCTEGSSEERTSPASSLENPCSSTTCVCENCSRETIQEDRYECNGNLLRVVKSESSLNLSELSGCDVINNSQEYLCDICDKCNSCSSGLSALSEISNISSPHSSSSFNSETSHIIAKQHCLALPKIKSASMDNIDYANNANQLCRENTVLLQKKTENSNNLNFNPDRCSLDDVVNFRSLQKTSPNSAKLKKLCPCDHKSLSYDFTSVKSLRRSDQQNSSRSLPLAGTSSFTNFRQICDRCEYSGRHSPRRSMVMFSENEGAFITIPLRDKEKYDPVNAV